MIVAFVMAFRIQPGKKMFAISLDIYLILSEKKTVMFKSNH